MKRLCTLLLSIVLVSTTIACFASGVDVRSLTDDQLSALQSEVSAEIASRKPTTGITSQVGKATVTIKGARMSKDYGGNDCIVISYEWSHQEDEAKSFIFYFSEKLFQGGIQLESAYFVDDVDSGPSMLDIRAGAVLEVERAFVLRDTTSPVEVEVKGLITFSDTGKLEATFTIPL